MVPSFIVAVCLLFLPPVQTRLSDTLVWITESPWRVAGLPVLALALFWSFPIVRHYLGDGELLMRTFRITVASRSWKGINAPLPYYILDRLRVVYPAEDVIRIFSILSGVLYTLAAVILSRRLVSEPRDRVRLPCALFRGLDKDRKWLGISH